MLKTESLEWGSWSVIGDVLKEEKSGREVSNYICESFKNEKSNVTHQWINHSYKLTQLYPIPFMNAIATNMRILQFFSPLGYVANQAIYFACVKFFLFLLFSRKGYIFYRCFFFIFLFFLVVTLGATLAQKPMVRSSRKFQDW